MALWFQDQPEPLILPRAAATTQIQAARTDQLIILPLPGAAPARWQPTIDQATQALRLAHWLAAPASPAPPPAPDSAAAQAARETLHRNIYQLLLGDPAATSQPK